MSVTNPTSPIPTDALFVAVDEKIYLLPRSIYADATREIKKADCGIVFQMRDYGAVLADMATLGPGIGAACVLVNLSSLKPPPARGGGGGGAGSGGAGGGGTGSGVVR
jgi:hypothetical protein